MEDTISIRVSTLLKGKKYIVTNKIKFWKSKYIFMTSWHMSCNKCHHNLTKCFNYMQLRIDGGAMQREKNYWYWWIKHRE